MKKENIIGIFDPKNNLVLMCKKTRSKFKGKYNFIGGKQKFFERKIKGAYREMFEESGIKTELFHLHDSIFYDENGKKKLKLQFFVGIVDSKNIKLIPGIDPLHWIHMHCDFSYTDIYAGNGDISHYINLSKQFLKKKEIL